MSPSKILFVLSISFVVGIFLESVIKIPQNLLWGFLLFNFLLIIFSIFIRKDFFIIFGFCFLFLTVGILRTQISEFNVLNDKLSKLNDKGQIVLTGIVYNESDVRDTFQKLKVKVADSIILVTTSRYPEYKYLDTIKIIGKLETPMVTEDFNYKNYLMKDGIYSVMNFPKIEIIGKNGGSPLSAIYSGILFCKGKIRESIQRSFSPPQSSILKGIIMGDKGEMSQELKTKFSIAGLSHIIAVSGTHIVILSSIIVSLLLAVGLWRGRAFYFAITILCIYIILIGLPASAIRAGIMGGLYLLAQKLGRQSMAPRIIVLAASIMLLFNPLLLFYDVGFQLSFLAVLGLIYLEPVIKNFIKNIYRIWLSAGRDKLENFTSILSATFAAQIFTLPIVIYNFGNISFVSPITNLLILPSIYLIMIFGFLTAIAGCFWNTLGFIFSIPCYFLLSYFVQVVNFFSQPWAFRTIENISWVWLVILYVAIIFVTGFLNKKYN